MKKLFYLTIIVMLGLSSCNNDEEVPKLEAGFTVTVENVGEATEHIHFAVIQ